MRLYVYQSYYFSRTPSTSFLRSSFDDYTTSAYVEDVVTLLQRYKSEDTVVICHSYGCTIGTYLYSRLAASETLNNSIKAMVMIGPKAVITEHERKGRAQLAKTPDWVVDFARKLDRMGGIHSKSVNRLLHASAGDDLRRKQLRWNKASRTFVLRRLMAGVQWPSPVDFQRIQCPLLLMSGEDVSHADSTRNTIFKCQFNWTKTNTNGYFRRYRIEYARQSMRNRFIYGAERPTTGYSHHSSSLKQGTKPCWKNGSTLRLLSARF